MKLTNKEDLINEIKEVKTKEDSKILKNKLLSLKTSKIVKK